MITINLDTVQTFMLNETGTVLHILIFFAYWWWLCHTWPFWFTTLHQL